MMELKVCPFCGGSEKIIFNEFKHGSNIVSVELKHWCPKSPLSHIIKLKAKTKEDVINIWNTRY